MIGYRHTIQTIAQVMQSDGHYTDEQIEKVVDFLKYGERGKLDLIPLREAMKIMGVSKVTLWQRLNDPRWNARGLRRIKVSHKQVFVDRIAINEIMEGKR